MTTTSCLWLHPGTQGDNISVSFTNQTAARDTLTKESYQACQMRNTGMLERMLSQDK